MYSKKVKAKKKREYLNSIIFSILKRSIVFPSIIIALISIIFIFVIFVYNNNKQIKSALLKIKTISKLYENSIIVSYNSSELYYKKEGYQIEANNKISVMVYANEITDIRKKNDCIDPEVYNIIFKNSYICYIKKVNYSRHSFYYLIKEKYDNKYIIYFQFILIFFFFITLSFLLSLFFINQDKILLQLKMDSKRFDDCLNLINKGDYKKTKGILNKITIYELYNAILKISNFNQKKQIVNNEVEKKSIIIHDLSKFINCIPIDLTKDNFDYELMISFIVNMRNLLRQNYDTINKYDIRKCIIEGASVLIANKIEIDLSKIKSHIFIGNENAMIQVFINIFSNILEHSYIALVKVYLKTSLETIDNNIFYVFIVKNTGSFVNINTNDDIFLKNFTTQENKNKRFGTGLYFCKNIIESYGGRVSYKSKENNHVNDSYFQLKIEIPAFSNVNEPCKNIKKNDLKRLEENKIQYIDNFVISVLEDDKFLLKKWKEFLGETKVYYYEDPQDFILDYKDNSDVSKTNLIITDYYFNNKPVDKLLDFEFLKEVMGFSGKIFLHTCIKSFIDHKNNFDYIIDSKDIYFSKEKLFLIFNNFNEFD
ncbi:ATP-binding protein [Fluviispira sanaruensis]|uniref:Histidine kinase/HSP90-like ATPase domain-containing protein n=1 Tax=Fluviispira sanaruensis TaxID=2493639 RepID=A0A4P2VHH2_FLUSA|nr:ATP-binding protein [Fluviispira sanaruensis]BBH51728.1 hypothetical protein JCM31447_01450 [Fluviispira sanaruensis]